MPRSSTCPAGCNGIFRTAVCGSATTPRGHRTGGRTSDSVCATVKRSSSRQPILVSSMSRRTPTTRDCCGHAPSWAGRSPRPRRTTRGYCCGSMDLDVRFRGDHGRSGRGRPSMPSRIVRSNRRGTTRDWSGGYRARASRRSPGARPASSNGRGHRTNEVWTLGSVRCGCRREALRRRIFLGSFFRIRSVR